MGKRAAWILLSSNSLSDLKCLAMEMELIHTRQPAAGDSGTSCFLTAVRAELYLSQILDETDLILFL